MTDATVRPRKKVEFTKAPAGASSGDMWVAFALNGGGLMTMDVSTWTKRVAPSQVGIAMSAWTFPYAGTTPPLTITEEALREGLEVLSGVIDEITSEPSTDLGCKEAKESAPFSAQGRGVA